MNGLLDWLASGNGQAWLKFVRLDVGNRRTYSVSARTDDSGRFVFDRVSFEADGAYYLQVEGGGGFVKFRKVLTEGGEFPVVMERSEPLEIRVVMAETGEPLPLLEVEIVQLSVPNKDIMGADLLKAVRPTNADGVTTVQGLPDEGEYSFRVWMPVKNGSRSFYNVTRFLPAADAGRRVRIEVPADEF